jgi:hypothetical protein
MTATTVSPERRSTLRRIAPAVGLVLLAPLVAEYLLGNISIHQLGVFFFLVPMYGGGALLVRELARRGGRGWPSMLLLASAYGLLEAGLLDMSLFNPSYLGQDFQSVAHVPFLGISAYWGLAFVLGHAVWSISVPIALVESFVPHRSATPWLGRTGLAVTAVAFVLGSLLIFWDHQVTQKFLPTAPQVVGTAAAVVALAGAAFAIGRRPRPALDRTGTDRAAPRPLLVVAAAFVAASLYLLVFVPGWPGVAMGTAVVAATAVVIGRWSRRSGWAAAHRLAVAGGALLTYAWVGFTQVPLVGSTGTVKLLGNAVLALAAVILLLLAARAVKLYQARTWSGGQPPAADRSTTTATGSGTT